MGFWGNVSDALFGGLGTKIDEKPKQYDQATGMLGQIASGAQNRAAPVAHAAQLGPAAQLATGQMDQTRQGALGTAGMLGQIASGQQAGAGELAVNRQMGQVAAQQMSAARSARGAGAALAYHNAMRNTADAGLAGAGQAAQAQMADQQGANAQLGQLYSGLYGQDASVAAQNAQLGQQAALQQGQFQQQTNLANQGASLQQQQMNDAAQIAALGQQLGWDQATINAQIAKSQNKGMLPDLLKAGGAAAAAASDERLKTDIADGGAAADDFMRGMRSTTWRYIDEKKWGKGNRLGIIAQDLARSEMGRKTLVDVDEQGHLGFDIGKAASAALASVARLHERLERVEGKSR